MQTPIINHNKLFFGNTSPIEFEHPIKETLFIDDIIIVLLSVPAKIVYNLNVFAFAASGDFLWRISETSLFYTGVDCPYIGIGINNEQKLILTNWCDTVVIVDHNTGEVLGKNQIK